MSFDQYVAAKVGDDMRVSSLELAVGTTSYNTKEATGLGYMGFLSYDADGYALPVEGNPGALFDRLFTGGSAKEKGGPGRGPAAEQEPARQRRRRPQGHLDEGRPGRPPQARRVATTVRELEKRINGRRRGRVRRSGCRPGPSAVGAAAGKGGRRAGPRSVD